MYMHVSTTFKLHIQGLLIACCTETVVTRTLDLPLYNMQCGMHALAYDECMYYYNIELYTLANT